MVKPITYSREEAADRLGVSIRTLDNYLARGVLDSELRPGVGLRKRRVVSAAAISNFLRRREQEAARG